MRCLLPWLLVLSLAGCFTAGKRGGDNPMAVYDFGTTAPVLVDAPRTVPVALEVRAPLWFDTLGIDYRLAYQDGARLREYARSRWAGPPAQLLQQQLARQLRLAGSGQGKTECVLRVDITEFSQVFSSPQNSVGVMAGKASLLDRARKPVGEMEIQIERPAPTPDARGGVEALIASVNALADQLLQWERRLQSSGNPGRCSG
ncbi:ABC-type transport auxiliary lipoprotein family protein [Azonexus sp. IMCC34839]|uniref:ABC-type transport auxiliary lipoprotein family protein n=1 Tax=Azonexus sp. IMCC34839 TaxID=3133695 RepID=UPI0039999185